MRYDLEIIEGLRDRPAIVFIHGLGMDKRIWVSPDEAKVIAGRFPIHVLLCKKGICEAKRSPKILRGIVIGNPYCELETVFNDLKGEGYSLIAWSQTRPAAPIDVAVSELRDILMLKSSLLRSGFILIGHSRGGLVGRRYLHLYNDRRVKALITISTPHHGTVMANFVKYLSPFASLIRPFIPESEQGTVLYILKRLSDFLSSKAVTELLPGSDFMKSLDDKEMDWVKYLSIGGSSPSLLCLNRISKVNDLSMERIMIERIFSLPDAIENLIPLGFLPEEMRKGKGDGLVSVKSSRLPWSAEHHTFNLNHAEILFSRKVRETLLNKIKEFTE